MVRWVVCDIKKWYLGKSISHDLYMSSLLEHNANNFPFSMSSSNFNPTCLSTCSPFPTIITLFNSFRFLSPPVFPFPIIFFHTLLSLSVSYSHSYCFSFVNSFLSSTQSDVSVPIHFFPLTTSHCLLTWFTLFLK